MPSFDYDFQYLKAGVHALEQYLLAAEVYWPLGVKAPGGEPPYPLLTLGALLLARTRLNVLDLDTPQGAALQKLELEISALHSRWSVAWEKKAAREFSARLRLWGDYLEEVRAQPENHLDRYAYEVGRRVMLALLQEQASGVPAAEIELLNGLDHLLRGLFASGAFIWEDVYQRAFPPQSYWYLYGSLKDKREK